MSSATRRPRFDGLWRQPDFLKLWVGETISLAGSQVTTLALPLTAVLVLNASAGEMGLLRAVGTAPFLLFGLVAGVWIDRLSRRPIVIGADLGRALLLASIPLASFLGYLRLEQLYVVTFLVAVLTLFFDVAHMSLLPSVVPRTDLVAANSKLAGSYSVVSIGGPGLAGGLVQLVTAPVAILLDAVSFVVSALIVGLVRAPESVASPVQRQRNITSELSEGVQAVLGHPVLRAFAGSTGTFNLFTNVWATVYILYLSRDLGLSSATIGMIGAGSGVGALLGTFVAGWISQRFGIGPTILRSAPLSLLAPLLIPLAAGPPEVVVGLLVTAQFLLGFGGTIYNLNLLSLRQAITPNHMLGRVTATMRFIAWGVGPIGALLGGVLGELIGLRASLYVGALGTLLSLVWLLLSPIATLREPLATSE
jgi:MFS family permease